jgi:hypothetical protein
LNTFTYHLARILESSNPRNPNHYMKLIVARVYHHLFDYQKILFEECQNVSIFFHLIFFFDSRVLLGTKRCFSISKKIPSHFFSISLACLRKTHFIFVLIMFSDRSHVKILLSNHTNIT